MTFAAPVTFTKNRLGFCIHCRNKHVHKTLITCNTLRRYSLYQIHRAQKSSTKFNTKSVQSTTDTTRRHRTAVQQVATSLRIRESPGSNLGSQVEYSGRVFTVSFGSAVQ